MSGDIPNLIANLIGAAFVDPAVAERLADPSFKITGPLAPVLKAIRELTREGMELGFLAVGEKMKTDELATAGGLLGLAALVADADLDAARSIIGVGSPEPLPAAERPDEARRSPYQLATSTADLRLLDITTEYLVEGLIPKGMITLFYAPSGLGKSTLANQLCQAVQDGTIFLGMQTVKAPVFYLDFENPLATIVDRLRKIGGKEPFPLWHHGSEVAPPQIDGKDRDLLLGIKPETLLVIDTLKACNDADENKATDMKPLFDFLKELRRHGLTILLLHHTTKGVDGGYRGSSVIQDQADHCISLAKVKAPGSDQEAADDDDTATYRFGTKGKTRAKPFRMFLTFDTERELFAATSDPATDLCRRVSAAIQTINERGEVANQGRIIEELEQDDAGRFTERKIRDALKRGTGTHWSVEKGINNARLFNLLPRFDGLTPCKGVSNRKTGTGHFDGETGLLVGNTRQDRMQAGFDGLTGGAVKPEKPDEPTMHESLPFADLELPEVTP